MIPMGKKRKELASERYEKMDPEERKYEARRRITRMIITRVILSVLLVWVMAANRLPFAVVLVLIATIVMILGTLIPVFKVLKTDLKYEDE